MLCNALPLSIQLLLLGLTHCTQRAKFVPNYSNKCHLAHVEGRICGPNDTTVHVEHCKSDSVCVHVCMHACMCVRT